MSVRSNAPVWARSKRAREYLSTSLQAKGPASLLPTTRVLLNAPRKQIRVALTTDALAELLVSRSRAPTDRLWDFSI
jgi:hypothetical protein